MNAPSDTTRLPQFLSMSNCVVFFGKWSGVGEKLNDKMNEGKLQK